MVGTSNKDSDGVVGVLDSGDLEDLRFVTETGFFDQRGLSELFGGQVIDVSDGNASKSLRF
jgi:hypothetical protein